MTAKLYVVRWVLARGILVMTGVLSRRKGTQGAQKDWYSLVTEEEDRYHRHRMCLGRDAFLTLPEAQAAAREVFEQAVRDAVQQVAQLTVALEDLNQGKLAVHDLTSVGDTKISKLRALK